MKSNFLLFIIMKEVKGRKCMNLRVKRRIKSMGFTSYLKNNITHQNRVIIVSALSCDYLFKYQLFFFGKRFKEQFYLFTSRFIPNPLLTFSKFN